MAGLVSKIPVWGHDSACAKGAGEVIFLSFLEILKTTVLNFMKATPWLQFDGAIYVINPASITYHCVFPEESNSLNLNGPLYECKITLSTTTSRISSNIQI
jgi:hypothetical protein